MAFSWNPFNKNINNNSTNPSAYSPQESINKSAKAFSSVGNDIDYAVSRRSVIGTQDTSQLISNPTFQAINNAMTVMPNCSNKQERISQYRSIAMFPECDWCLDEICDDFIHTDEDGNFINIKFSNKDDLNPVRQDIIETEFAKFVELFRFRDEGFNLIKRYLIEGELAFENIINAEKPELGIIGVKFLPTEYYQTLIDTSNGRAVGIYFDTVKFSKDLITLISSTYLGSQQVFNTMMVSSVPAFNKNNCIVMLWPQVTYINSGEVSPDGLVSYSLLEKCKQAYHQLSLLQDAAVILRVTRAPERLLFNISTGRMSQHYADEYVRNFANDLKSKKVSGGSQLGPNGTPDVASVYSPVTMLDSYVFAKSDANDGTTVETIGSSASYEEIGDIEYFLRRLMKQFKVPYSRYKTPENTVERDETISYEEYAFTRMIIRLQRNVALGLKKSFITHLKLRGIWDKYNLKDNDITLVFNQPVLYDLYQTQKMVSTKMETYATIADRDELSKMMAMKKILGYSDSEIEENYKNLIKEAQLVKLAEYYAEKLNEDGPATFDCPVPIKGHTIKLPADAASKSDSDSADSEDGGDTGEDDTDSGDEDEDSTDSPDSEEEGGDEAPSDDAPATNAPAPTFGLS